MSPVWIAEAKPWLDKYRLTIDWKDLDGYWRRLRKARPAVNLATYVGAATGARAWCSARGGADRTRPAAPDAAGGRDRDAAGRGGRVHRTHLSAGLVRTTAELVALAKAAGKHGGLYASHIRGEDDVVMQALEEAITIGKEAQVPVEIWHLKTSLRKNWAG
jgi:dihydroorotase/N-acyl-D-amino-acid deacylase